MATDNLMKKIETEEPDLLLIQEPYEYKNRLTGVSKQYRIYIQQGENIEQQL